MPLLTKRRSFIDIFNTQQSDSESNRPTTDNLAPENRSPSPTRPASEYGFPKSRLSHEVRLEDLPDARNGEGGADRPKRFSLMKFRNLSESHLAVRAKEVDKKQKEEESRPPLPTIPLVPSIVRTAPTYDSNAPQTSEPPNEEADEEERKMRQSFFKRSMSKGRSPSRRSDRAPPRKSMDDKRSEKKGSSLRWRRLQGRSTGLEDLQRMASQQAASNQSAPPSYGDDSNTALALPVSGDHRMSESSRSDGSNEVYASTTTTTHTVSTHTTFFKLPRRNKNRNSLFPLPVKLPPPGEQEQRDEPATPRASISAMSSKSQGATPNKSPPKTILPRRHTETNPNPNQVPPLPTALARQSLAFAEPAVQLNRNDSQRSRASSNSSPLQPPMRLSMRDRASTTSSLGRASHDLGTPPPLNGSGRNSTSTTGRSSLGGLLNLSRFRQSSEPHSPRYGSPGLGSKSNSFAISREALVVPEREEGDTPGKYLERLEAAVARSMIAGILSKSPDPFAQAVLRSYTRRFPFFGEPIDMSLRKFLLEAELPKETQQVDRVIQAFADRYHECNPGIFLSADQAYVIAFSLMMLHTDAFNKNNKRKMQKHDYIKNTSGQSVSDDVLGCFYDNICYTPFVHYEEEVDINGERVLPFKPPKKSKLKGAITDSGKKPSGPVDPYNVLVDQKLDMLRPPIRDSITMEDPYNYRANDKEFDPLYLQRSFTHTGVLQIVSQRSRPNAYEGTLTTNSELPNTTEMQPGIIDIKISKVGTLWRKAAKKKKTRSPWQEWGAILTGSQLYLFKNAHWAKGLMHQFTAAQRIGQPRIPVVFKPPLQDFKPDALIKTDNAVALVDSMYNRHKNAFMFVRAGGQEEVLLADNEAELHDWLALINYAAAFRAAGVRIRGMAGGLEGIRSSDVHRVESTQSARSARTVETALNTANRGLTAQLQRQVMAARRQIMVLKVGEMGKDIVETSKELDKMLRNARHLLVLAPVVPKTREDIIHAAAHADASIKWARRDIWRLKCHKDILCMDVQQDGVSASELEQLAEQQVNEGPESARKARIRGLSRLKSTASGVRSPPLSPTSPSDANRHSTAGSMDPYIADDVFMTPPTSATQQRTSEEWHIPPLQLDVLREEQEQKQQREQQRGSVSSAILSTSSQARGSVSPVSTSSSAQQVERETSESNRGRMTPSLLADDPKVEMLARQTMSPQRMDTKANRAANLDGAPPSSTPDRKAKGGVRRSLQKTLRDTQHGGSTHKHRRGKDSDGTIRSGGHEGENIGDAEEGTPGLKREKGRFILHGKQASVVHFGEDWPDERMKSRREVWRQSSISPRVEQTPRALSYRHHGWRADPISPVIRDFNPHAYESPGEEEDDDDDDADDHIPGKRSREEPASYFEITGFEGERNDRRETVIGPKHQGKHSLQKSDDGNVISDRDSVEPSDQDVYNGKRTTVIGPSKQAHTQAGAQESDDGSMIDDEGLRREVSPRTVEVA